MNSSHPLFTEYRKSISQKMALLQQLVQQLKQDCSLQNLKELQREIHKLAGSSGTYGYLEVSRICKNLELDILVHIKNFHLTSTQKWVLTLDPILQGIEKAFDNTSSEPPTATKEAKKRVIAVDDDEDILNLLRTEFHALGFEVVAFTTGAKALEFLSHPENLNDVFLIILDRILPDMDGLDILQQSAPKTAIPILMLSQLSSEHDILEGLQGGAVDYMTKPFSVYKLMQKALNLLKIQV
ncbi:MAG: response regulator [Verrucomicrobia bacterium]|nr:response regulator [Verrucomicrobiota bacterium]MBS0646755.1 response regulator [Verrucomicrobiota bacterium]